MAKNDKQKKKVREVMVVKAEPEMPDLQSALDRVGMAIAAHQSAFTAYSAHLLTLEGIAVQKLEGSKVEVAQDVHDQLTAALEILATATKMIAL